MSHPEPRLARLDFTGALASLLQTLIAALFVLTFVAQPYVIPSESMEPTLLVGDFLLVNKQAYAPAGPWSRWILPYKDVERGEIAIVYHSQPSLLVKRVLGLPGDRIHLKQGRLYVNGALLEEPYVQAEPNAGGAYAGGDFPARTETMLEADPLWRSQLPGHIRNGELIVPPGQYFLLGDNRNHSRDSRMWGFAPREAVMARPLAIYFSLNRTASEAGEQGADDRLGHQRESPSGLMDFARWKRIFRLVR